MLLKALFCALNVDRTGSVFCRPSRQRYAFARLEDIAIVVDRMDFGLGKFRIGLFDSATAKAGLVVMDHELIAASMLHDGLGRDEAAQRFAGVLDHLIAHVVPERVVDRLEIVGVDKGDVLELLARHRALGTLARQHAANRHAPPLMRGRLEYLCRAAA